MTAIDRAALDTRQTDFGAAQTGTGRAGGPYQVAPAATASGLLAAELAELEQDQLTEGEEGAALNLGTRLRGALSPRRPDSSMARSVLARMKAALGDAQRAHLDGLLAQFEALGDEEEPVRVLRDAGLSDGTIALVIASLHARALDARRKRLNAALQALLAEGADWALELFSLLELGPHSAATSNELRQLYERAGERLAGLARWFAEFRKTRERRAKIRILVRVLGLELSNGGARDSDPKLAATIIDLKRLLIFLGVEEQCQYVAQSLETAGLDGERVLSSVLAMIDEALLYPDWLYEEATELGLRGEHAAHYCQRLLQLVKMLPMPCFNDLEHRSQVIDTLLLVAEHYETQ
ncbi:TyeA family type III secretion system gatekeeper subunit [Burkholderia sp. WSM2232]|uniref:TyeA family type III secretion system gatekeeper subunit n=1 Tax=Burkholderia sp. WSM2232 TaxID=944436 RepID=UPI0004031585|nr:TyeA family type III secretion system gatekeeper subunit [Burkholderia sp. WSM2232]